MTAGTRPTGKRGTGAWSVDAFAHAIGVSKRTVDNYRSGFTIPPDVSRICDVLFGDDVGHFQARVSFLTAFDEARGGALPALSGSAKPFVGVPPHPPHFIGRTTELDRLDVILKGDKPVGVIQAVGRAAVLVLNSVRILAESTRYFRRRLTTL
jgi:hypothetical protein